MELFARQGYLKTTLVEVGKAAGYTGGLVSHRFGSKEGLLNAVVDHATRRFLDDQLTPAISGADISGAEARLRSYISTYFQEVFVRESHIRALYVIMGEALGAVPEIRAKIARLNRAMRGHIAGIIEEGVKASEFRSSVNPEASAMLIVGLLRGVTMQYLTDARAHPREELLPTLQASAISALK
jgi:AcrR family transcriptional regulator